MAAASRWRRSRPAGSASATTARPARCRPGGSRTLVRVLAPGAEAVLIWSTNLPGWLAVPGLEAELGIPVLDSASVGVWACLAGLGLDPGPAAACGRIFTVAG